MSVTLIIRGSWRLVDKILALRAVKRRATWLPAPYVDELASKRFGCLAVCAGCEWKYREGLRHHAYAKHPEWTRAGGACDFCQADSDRIPLWFAEEKRDLSITRAALTDERRRRLAPVPEGYRG